MKYYGEKRFFDTVNIDGKIDNGYLDYNGNRYKFTEGEKDSVIIEVDKRTGKIFLQKKDIKKFYKELKRIAKGKLL